MENVVVGHTKFSWHGSGIDMVPIGHTKFSWVGSFDGFLKRYGKMIDAMDDVHGDRFLFGQHSDMFDDDPVYDDGTNPDNWVCPWQASDVEDIDGLMEFVELGHEDVLLDIGCGDGRVVVRAVQRLRCYGVGVDISKECIDCANYVAKMEGCSNRTSFFIYDFCEFDAENIPAVFEKVTVVYIYLVPNALKKARKLVDYFLGKGNVKVCTHEYHYSDLSVTRVGKVFDLQLYQNSK